MVGPPLKCLRYISQHSAPLLSSSIPPIRDSGLPEQINVTVNSPFHAILPLINIYRPLLHESHLLIQPLTNLSTVNPARQTSLIRLIQPMTSSIKSLKAREQGQYSPPLQNPLSNAESLPTRLYHQNVHINILPPLHRPHPSFIQSLK